MNNENWRIAYEGNCWTVYERRVMGPKSKAPGQLSDWTARSHHATAEQACLSLFNRLLAEGLGDADLTNNVSHTLEAIRAAQERVSEIAGTLSQPKAKAA